MTFRSRVFATALLATAVTLSVAVGLLSYHVRSAVNQRIEQSLVAQARLAAETLSHRRPATPEELDAEADDLGRLVSARVTFIAPDGTGHRRLGAVGDGAACRRKSRRPSGSRSGGTRRLRSRAPAQHHDRHRHAVCRGSREERGGTGAGAGPARAPTDRRQRSVAGRAPGRDRCRVRGTRCRTAARLGGVRISLQARPRYR